MKVKHLRKVMNNCWFFIEDKQHVLWNEKLQGEIPRDFLKKRVKTAVAWSNANTPIYVCVEIKERRK